MPNITIQVSDALYQHARLSAAQRNMTVSALLRALLLTLPKNPAEATPKGQKFEERFQTMPEFCVQHEAEELKIAQYYKNRELHEKANSGY